MVVGCWCIEVMYTLPVYISAAAAPPPAAAPVAVFCMSLLPFSRGMLQSAAETAAAAVRPPSLQCQDLALSFFLVPILVGNIYHPLVNFSLAHLTRGID